MSEKPTVRICILYPADPVGAVPSGIDTFIRGTLRWAPDDMEIMLIGATTDAVSRPIGQWSECSLGERDFRFFPLLNLTEPGKQNRIPSSLSYTVGLVRYRSAARADLLVFHGIEPVLAFIGDGRPKSVVIHQDMQVLRNPGSDIRWKYAPWLYFGLERLLMPRFQSVFCVRQNAVEGYKRRFSDIAERFFFTPTWVDTDIFMPAAPGRRNEARNQLHAEFGFDVSDQVLISVGRLDSQKNPMLLIEAFERLVAEKSGARLLMVGDGQMRGKIEEFTRARGLTGRIILCGVKGPEVVARYLRGADAFVLSSAYEGMPMCVLEALGSGLPVVSTSVGEVSRVVKTGINGEIVAAHDVETFKNGIIRCLAQGNKYRGERCVESIKDYTAKKVLAPIYENYRRLARGLAS